MRAPRPLFVVALTVVLTGLLTPATALPELPRLPLSATGLRAGVAVSDLTWHVGAGAGQYATDLEDGGSVATLAEGEGIDPHAHSVKKVKSYGVAVAPHRPRDRRRGHRRQAGRAAQERQLPRAGPAAAPRRPAARGRRAAASRVDDILHAATHNHSSPYYTTTSPPACSSSRTSSTRGMFEYQARAIARRHRDGRPPTCARRGWPRRPCQHDVFKGNVVGPALADDGTPAGYPREFGDNGLVVMRFDDVTDRQEARSRSRPG